VRGFGFGFEEWTGFGFIIYSIDFIFGEMFINLE
jgi:hypothetical protein